MKNPTVLRIRSRLGAQVMAALVASAFLLSTARADFVFNEAVTSTAVQVTPTPAHLIGYTIVNRDASNAIFVHFYNALAANVTVGTTTQNYVVPVGANGAVVLPVNNLNTQYTFTNAMTIAITTGPLSTSSTAPGTAAVVYLSYGRNP